MARRVNQTVGMFRLAVGKQLLSEKEGFQLYTFAADKNSISESLNSSSNNFLFFSINHFKLEMPFKKIKMQALWHVK